MSEFFIVEHYGNLRNGKWIYGSGECGPFYAIEDALKAANDIIRDTAATYFPGELDTVTVDRTIADIETNRITALRGKDHYVEFHIQER